MFYHQLRRAFSLPAQKLAPNQGRNLCGPPDSHLSLHLDFTLWCIHEARNHPGMVKQGGKGLWSLMPWFESVLSS